MAMPSTDQIMERLRTVNDPELHKDLVSLNMIKSVTAQDGRVKVHVELTTPACPLKEPIQRDVRAALMALDGVRDVEVEFSASVRGGRQTGTILPQVKNVVAVGAGKGGVGKSTAAVLLSIGLHRSGAKVGLMDADVYGPSIPTLMGVEGTKPQVREESILPIMAAGVKVMSIGFMIERDKPLIWRGPMVHGVVKQFLEQVEWGDLDYLIVDLPPGTGDVPLTMAQLIPMTGAVIICTPQDVALIDARRAIMMYAQLRVDCLGIIENMSYYLCPKCGHREHIFDHGGAAKAAEELGVPFLGEIPLNADIRRFGDAGAPQDHFTRTEGYVRESIQNVVERLAGQISVKNMGDRAAPTLTIEE